MYLRKLLNISPFLVIILLSLVIYSKTFSMALVGDDYLGLWRMIKALEDPKWNLFNYFFTDYGPQDTITYILHSLFDFKDWIYYSSAFLLRIIAAFSIYRLSLFLTKNKTASLISMAYFLFSYTGIETNDWSFNMPSFLSIIAICFHIYYLLKAIEEFQNKKVNFIYAIFFLYLSIVLQPIRATFMPIFSMASIIFYSLFTKKINIRHSIPYIISVFFAFYLLITFTKIGTTFGISQEFNDRLTLNWFNSDNSNISNFVDLLKGGEFQILLNPLIQLGESLFPYKLLPSRFEVINSSIEMFSLVLTQLLIYSVFITWLKFRHPSKYIFASSAWIIFCLAYFSYFYNFPVESIRLFGLVNSGLVIITILISNFSNINKSHKLLILFGFVLLTYVAPWVRDPNSVQAANSRYLIITTLGVSLLIAEFITKHKSVYKYFFIIIYLSMHFYLSFSYFRFLSQVRNVDLVNDIRSSIPYNPVIAATNEPVIYYLESDNPDILYHSIGFGLPVILYFQQPIHSPWNIAVTDNYYEVQSAYLDGQGLVRFGIEKQRLPIENIFSLKVESGNLIDKSEEIRNRLSTENSL